MSRHSVSCINKRPSHYDAHTRIERIGGINPDNSRWSLSENEAIASIKNGTYEFYVVVNAMAVNVIIATHDGREYLKTTADGYSPNNLLALPECPR